MKKETTWLLECDSSCEDLEYLDFKEEFYRIFGLVFEQAEERRLLISVEAKNSNWRGQTGHSYVDSAKDLLSKILDGNHFESTKIGYYPAKNASILSSGHDTPTGSSISIVAVKDKDRITSQDIFPIVYDRKLDSFKVLRFSIKTFVNRQRIKLEKEAK